MAQKDVSIVDALKEENQRLRRAVDELSALNEIATAVSSTQTLAQVLELIIRKCVKYLQVEQAAVMLLDERKEEKPFQTMVRQGDQTSHVFPYHLDLAQQNLVYANAGHNPPLLFAEDQSYRTLAGGGIMLGCMDAMDYGEEKSPLLPGEILLVYSDGMSEALNEQGEEFGEKRLIEVVKKNRLMTAKEIGEAIYQSVTAHVGVAPQFDDMTIVLIKRSPA